MIDRKHLLADLKPLLKELEADLRARCDEVAEISARLKREYDAASSAGRCGVTFEEWRGALVTQVGAAWVLSCVFVRFLEDNGLISPPWISGPLRGGSNGGMQRARDERDVYFKSHPKNTDRDYLLAVFDDLAKLPGLKDLFGPHNPVGAYRQWLSGDAAQKLIEFFQKIDADGTGELIHDFTDANWDTRFLGDLYQDLSEAARKKYALLQTPIFVEEFILEHTLEPAINEFGLAGFKMIDPACGSGHFLLGAFARILDHWRKREPGTSDRELVNRTLASVHGVDLNPYAVAIARFCLLLAAIRVYDITKLKDAPAFAFNLACGDSLLHGAPGTEQQLLGFHELAHHYQSEDIGELRRILHPAQYHTVVANPPYIAVADPALNSAYRDRYPTCYGQYSLTVPFIERLHQLAQPAGYVGQITGNAFSSNRFGKRVVAEYLPKLDLTHVIDTSLAFIPAHGTPTVILLSRSRPPLGTHIRLVQGRKREDNEPQDPANGLVWTSILTLLDRPGTENDYVSVSNVDRDRLSKHPWVLRGGGVADLKDRIDASCSTRLSDLAKAIGRTTHTGCNEAFAFPSHAAKTYGLLTHVEPFISGDDLRDFICTPFEVVVMPYDRESCKPLSATSRSLMRFFWPNRTFLRSRQDYGELVEDRGLRWYEHSMFFPSRYRDFDTIAFPCVATHNHFVAMRSRSVSNPHAPRVFFNDDVTRERRERLLFVMNCSTVGFWQRQVMRDRGGGGIGGGIAAEAWERFFEHVGSKLEECPLPDRLPAELLVQSLGREIRTLAAIVHQLGAYFYGGVPDALTLSRLMADWRAARARAIALQEELDWECYGLYAIIDDPPRCEDPPAIELGQRAFEIVLARKMAWGEEETAWFSRHNSTPITEIPASWPEAYRDVVQRRLEIIDAQPDIALIERPEYKRRWNTSPWEQQQQSALRGWLLNRLEGYCDLDGRMNDERRATADRSLHQVRLISAAQLADLARADRDFMQVAELFVGRLDFDVAKLVGELAAAESVPALPVLRYKPAAQDKRAAWERTWELQRLEDAVDALFEVERLKKLAVEDGARRDSRTSGTDSGMAEATLRPLVSALPIAETARTQVLREAVSATGYVVEAVRQNLNLESDTILKPVQDAAKRAKKAAVGDIPVPPKYTSADFLSSNYWRLRGKLDVPKERWVSFPYCEGEDGSLAIAWAGYDHLQLARAIAERYELAKEHEGRKLVPLLAVIGQLIPWLKQWHNDLDPAFGTRMGDHFEGYLAEETKALGMTVAEVMAWTPPEKMKRSSGRRKAAIT